MTAEQTPTRTLQLIAEMQASAVGFGALGGGGLVLFVQEWTANPAGDPDSLGCRVCRGVQGGVRVADVEGPRGRGRAVTGRVPAYVAEYLLLVDRIPILYVVVPSGEDPAVATFKGWRYGERVSVVLVPMRRLCATCWALHNAERPHGHDGPCLPEMVAEASDAAS